ncbi:unnamed protein product [Callosobruchus maculatus]|nr:unnamed protein product [Callosobruchus maculatus]
MDFFEDDLEILNIIENGFPRKVYKRTNHYQEMDEFSFFRRFRLYKSTVLAVLQQIEDELEYPDNRNNSISPVNQLLCCLRFFASSGHLLQTADFMAMDVSTVSRIIAKVSCAIARLFPLYVRMPQQQELVKEQNKFYNVARFPRIIGMVDGTHIRIQSPGNENAEVYRNRKSYFSMNVQVVGSADLKFLDVVARWPGSAHDATIFANSTLRARFENHEFPNCLLIGDSGYPLRNYFMTPLVNPATQAERLYNESLIRTRNGIERMIGLWKRRFPVIAYGIRLKMDTVKTVIVATTVLHNIARCMNEPEPPIPEDIDADQLNYLIETANINLERQEENVINNIQYEIINTYFAGL